MLKLEVAMVRKVYLDHLTPESYRLSYRGATLYEGSRRFQGIPNRAQSGRMRRYAGSLSLLCCHAENLSRTGTIFFD